MSGLCQRHLESGEGLPSGGLSMRILANENFPADGEEDNEGEDQPSPDSSTSRDIHCEPPWRRAKKPTVPTPTMIAPPSARVNG